MNRVCTSLLVTSALSSSLCLAGCGAFRPDAPATVSTSTLGPLQGRVHGGDQPDAGAHVYLYAAGTTGTAGKDIAGTSANASLSLLRSTGGNVHFDGTNYYVLTDTTGSFSITGDYTCTSGTQVYLYAAGGNPGAGTNSSASFLSGVGACPTGASTLPSTAFFTVNEVTTAAMAYAMAGYASDALHISANTSLNGNVATAQMMATGLANAMANVANLINPATGVALTVTAAGNGVVPQPLMNTLGNILSACINSSDVNPGKCMTLFGAALSDGTSGTTPAETASAAINIAHNAALNVTTLYGLQPATAAPFMPDLAAQPNDFSVQLLFGGGGASSPHAMVIDAGGNIWGASGNVVNVYSPLGVPLYGSPLATATTNAISSLTIDPDGDIWAQDSTGKYSEFSPSGTLQTGSGGTTGANSGSSALTTDSFGYFWSTNSSDGTLYRFDPIAGVVASSYTLSPSSLIAADSAGFIWVGAANGTLYKINQVGATIASYALYSAGSGSAMVIDNANNVYVDNSSSQNVGRVTPGGAISAFTDSVGGARSMAVDGVNDLWAANHTVSEHSASGTLLTGSGLALPSGTSTTSIAIDTAGNLWAADTLENTSQAGTHYTELVGAAAPQLTPTSYVATHGTLQSALNLTIGFNGPDVQFPYMTQFYNAQSAYFQSIGLTYPAGGRYCHAYMSWDVAEQPVGNGPVGTEGSRAWLEDWLAHAQGNCDRALITFKYISGITVLDSGTYPSASDYETGVTAFLNTDWSYTGWTGAFDYTAWNEPQNGSASGDGLTIPIPVQRDADYYLALRKHCTPPGCTVAAGDFASNGSFYTSFVQNCSSDLTLCGTGSYMDQYKYYVVNDAPTYGFTTSFRPEVFSYHGWDDINNYINSANHCTDPAKCTARAFVTAMSETGWTNTVLWDTEVAAGQAGSSNPTPVVQGCAASFLLDITNSVTNRITRLYWTQPYVSGGMTFAMFDANGVPKPSFYVMADRNIAYQPPAGYTCP